MAGTAAAGGGAGNTAGNTANAPHAGNVTPAPYFTDANAKLAAEIIARYPQPRSALIPLLHLAQEQSGYVTPAAMQQVGELVGASPAEVLGTLSFYEMFKQTQPGKFQLNICHGISCFLCGSAELLHHAEAKLGIPAGGTTPDGMFSLEAVECIAACTEAPAMQANYRYFNQVTAELFDETVAQLAAGELDDVVPPHGTLARVRQHIPAERAAGVSLPDAGETPVWLEQGAEPAEAEAQA